MTLRVSPLQRAQLYPPSPDSFYDWPRHYDFTRNSQRFMAYIPLHEDGFSLYGLTAFCSNKGLVGLSTHFCSQSHSPKSYWYGEQEGCPVHVQFGKSEAVSLLTVFWHRNDHLIKAYLIVCSMRMSQIRTNQRSRSQRARRERLLLDYVLHLLRSTQRMCLVKVVAIS